MTISQAMSILIKRRERCAQYKRDHWPEFVTYMRTYMVRYRRTPRGKAVVRKANQRYFKKHELAHRMYHDLYRLMLKDGR
jgi:sulfur relay (sulfurtransferase) DsrC/TusE family protein